MASLRPARTNETSATMLFNTVGFQLETALRGMTANPNQGKPPQPDSHTEYQATSVRERLKPLTEWQEAAKCDNTPHTRREMTRPITNSDHVRGPKTQNNS